MKKFTASGHRGVNASGVVSKFAHGCARSLQSAKRRFLKKSADVLVIDVSCDHHQELLRKTSGHREVEGDRRNFEFFTICRGLFIPSGPSGHLVLGNVERGDIALAK